MPASNTQRTTMPFGRPVHWKQLTARNRACPRTTGDLLDGAKRHQSKSTAGVNRIRSMYTLQAEPNVTYHELTLLQPFFNKSTRHAHPNLCGRVCPLVHPGITTHARLNLLHIHAIYHRHTRYSAKRQCHFLISKRAPEAIRNVRHTMLHYDRKGPPTFELTLG